MPSARGDLGGVKCVTHLGERTSVGRSLRQMGATLGASLCRLILIDDYYQSLVVVIW
jgi:hypothetical protein